MAEKRRLSLKDASAALGLTESGVRARFKGGKLEGERDNQGKIWVFVSPDSAPKMQVAVKAQSEGALEVYRGLVDTLKQQVASLSAERDALYEKADEATRLTAHIAAVEAASDLERVRRESAEARLAAAEEERANWQAQAERLTLLLTDQRKVAAELRRPWWERLFRGGSERHEPGEL